jgi:HlyD family secretion protein
VNVVRGFAVTAAFCAAAAGGYVASARWALRGPLPDGLVRVRGRVEGDRVAVACRYPGRVNEVRVREGDEVAAGQVLVVLDEAQARSGQAQARELVKAAEAQVRAGRAALEVLTREAPLAVEEAEAEVAHARASVALAEVLERRAGRDDDRSRATTAGGAPVSASRERPELTSDVARGDLAVARAGLTRAEKRLEQARLGRDRVRAKTEELAALEAQVRLARAEEAEADARLAELTVRASGAGMVASRPAAPGEFVPAGAPLVELVDLDALYLRADADGPEAARLRPGSPALVTATDLPGPPVAATTRRVAPGFSAGSSHTVTLDLDANPGHRLLPGLAAEAVIRARPDAPWPPPR